MKRSFCCFVFLYSSEESAHYVRFHDTDGIIAGIVSDYVIIR